MENLAHPHAGAVLDSFCATKKHCAIVRDNFAQTSGDCPQRCRGSDENNEIGGSAIFQIAR